MKEYSEYFIVRLRDAEIDKLKALLIRAADALEEEFGYRSLGPLKEHQLIAELRKAAE